MKFPGIERPLIFKVSLSGDQLSLDGLGAAKTPLQALSENEFSAPIGNLKFPKEVDGAAPYVTFQLVEGDFKALRK